ncbi:MAG TPA: PIN domain-containing protein [Pyrinomonadaceae bacterium]|jgi:predicted nucleic acid-binding protein|nr:PIN domain-containing protein [Pyrinomonadaceae bacterium]
MSYLVDTNILLRLVQKNHPMRPDARRALITLRNQGEELCVTPQNIIEFYAVATRPLAANGLGLSADAASREIRKLKRIFKLHPDSQAIFTEWEQLVSQYQVMGEAGTRYAPCGRDEGAWSLTYSDIQRQRF